MVADEVYGSDSTLRRALEVRDQAYVLAVRSNQALATWPPYGPPGQTTPAAITPAAWTRLSCGDGAQGPRVYDWAWVPLRPALHDGWVHALLLRRHPDRPAEVAWSLVYAPEETGVAEIVRAAGTRWTIEEVFKLAKGQVGLDHDEVRSWQGWYRHITLALVALAALATVAKKGASPASITSASPSPNCGACSSGSPGRSPGTPPTSSAGPAGAAPTNALLRRPISVAA